MYRVHPLPESMIDFVYDFGSLSSTTESIYIKAMLRRMLGNHNPADYEEVAPAPAAGGGFAAPYHYTARMNPFAEFVEVFAELVCAAQVCKYRNQHLQKVYFPSYCLYVHFIFVRRNVSAL